jgi:PAS domain-containing protein
LSEKHRLRVFWNRALRRMLGLKREEVAGGWNKLHNEELCKCNLDHIVIRLIKSLKMRWVGHITHVGEKILVRKPDGRDQL